MVLVTGANSFLGTYIVAELIKQGYSVRSLVRHSAAVLEQTDLMIGNVNSPSDLQRAMVGCDTVIHIASITAQNLIRLDDYRFNWECAQKVAQAATGNGIKRLIYISTANTVGNGTPHHKATEEREPEVPYSKSLYTQSKLKAEKATLDNFPRAIIINPSFMIGAWSGRPSSTTIISRTAGRRVVFIPNGAKSFVNSRDVATATVNAITQGREGERYLASGTTMTIREFYTLMQKISGTRFHMITTPNVLLLIGGLLGNALRFLGFKTPVSLFNMQILCCHEYYNNSKAINELSMPQTSIEEALRNYFDSLTIQ